MSKGQNWRSFALNDVISNHRNMYLLDLRNHGDSDHHASMTYEEMANDVIRYADDREIDQFAIIGHNIGAKTAMTLSCMYPDRVSALICLDTLPLSFRNQGGSYGKMIQASFENIKSIKETKIEGLTRKAAIDKVKKEFSQTGMANLITGNIVYEPESDNKTVKWCINLDAIVENFPSIVGFDDEKKLKQFSGPSLFVSGSMSIGNLQGEGVLPETEKLKKEVFEKYFTDCTAVIVDGVGHYLHAEKPS